MQTGSALINQIFEALGDVQIADPSREPGPTATLLNTVENTGAKTALLTLHFLFPHELLPALDLIDRRLITSLRTRDVVVHRDNHSVTTEMTTQNFENVLQVFYVRSASSSTAAPRDEDSMATGRFREAYHQTKHFYQVNLHAWNCNCPAFAYSAMKLLANIPDTGMRNHPDQTAAADHVSQRLPRYGGIATIPNHVVPICKHMLAVCLAQSAPALFGHGIAVAEVDRSEIAGWLHD